ncbi:DNA-binding transcriptional activator of the SARP family [Actinokineospora alba]|uniref:DNA-binding transcriptional activator of the SARP family n=1 Tax=Actinokineospora alba TaxID=504798 RepID=A0A1H0LCY1_9PSEU|nr:DNA-binding SARP family transcriptional activator [Actinokineospora alba]SDJ01742.1 DNA-binding transcriptional activator of the SARP family [Actinokineospora alba]SDO66077.1 DNA-binding transcriptional activator of the SARP family [Actinokineospora alba]
MLRGLIATAALLVLVAGVPWALSHYIGWPLPDHVPDWAEVRGVLLGPMSTTFLLSFLACLIWIVWAAFTLDVFRCAIDLARSGVDTVRLPDFSGAGPVHALAGLLVGAVLLSVLGNRAAPAPTSPSSSALGSGAHVVATAPAWQHPADPGEVVVRNAVFATSAVNNMAVSSPARPVSVVVLAPHDGVYDSLWRIAKRTLGDGARWPEIFEANKGKPQPDGRPFTRPSLIFPGQELALPADTTAAPTRPAPPPHEPPAPTPTTPAPTPAPTTAPPTNAPPTDAPLSAPATTPAAPNTERQPTATRTDARPAGAREPAFQWGSEIFVGLGLAAAVSTALLIARRRYRARYRPGSGDRDDLPMAPVVYQLHLAHLRAGDDEVDLDSYWDDEDGDNGDGDALDDAPRPRRVPPPPTVVIGAPTAHYEAPRTAVAPGLGVRDGREIALDLAASRGLGLVGAGAPAAVRALLLAALTTADRPAGSGAASVVVPAEDLAAVLGRPTTDVPTAVRVVADLDAALDVLEAETLVRAASRDSKPWPPLVLIARPPHQHPRLQAVLDNGAPIGVTGLLLGQWQPGVTCYVRDDGTITSTSPGLGEALRGTRMFRLGGDDTADLLALLRHTESPADDSDSGDDEPLVSPMTRPWNGRVPGRSTDPGGNAAAVVSMTDTELEVTAAVTTAPPADTELEILGSRSPRTPRARLRPQAAPRLASSETRSRGEVEDASAPTSQHASPAVREGTEDGVADGQRALITVTVLGGLRVHWHPDAETDEDGPGREITGALQPRSQVLLVLLALHPDGATRDTLVDALWGEDPPARPTNSLHTALSRLRRDLSRATDGTAGEVAAADNGRYRLDPARVRVDYWRFAAAVAARRTATTDAERVAAYREIVDSYSGRVADGMSKIDWLEPIREATRREAIDAVSALARALIAEDPQQTLDLLEVARAFDPHNELLYRDIMRLQGELGQLDAIPRTLTLLTTRLAEVGDEPTAKSRRLAANLSRQHDTDHTERADRSAGPVPPAVRSGHGRSA